MSRQLWSVPKVALITPVINTYYLQTVNAQSSVKLNVVITNDQEPDLNL